MGENAKDKRLSYTVREGISDSMELNNLLFAISEAFPLVISVNLTKNTYKMLEYENYKTKKAATGGVFDDLIAVGASTVDPAHRQKFLNTFSRDKLLQAYASGVKKVELDMRQLQDTGDYGWVRTTVIFLTNYENDEVLELTLARPIEDLKAKELDNLRLRTVLEMSMLANYEYISLVNIKTGQYELYADGSKNTHRAPAKGDYEKAMMLIRDTLVPEAEREAYFKKAKLSTVLTEMKKAGHYRFRYRIEDTPEKRWRETAFHYCLPDEDELLQTVRDVHDEVLVEQARQAEEELRRNKEIQEILTGLGLDIVIDVDLATARAQVLGDERSFLNRNIICEDFPMGEIQAGMIHPEDIDAVTEALDLSRHGKTFSVDFRMKHEDGSFLWCRSRTVILRDDTGKPYRCIIKLIGIDEQKKSEQELLYNAQRDSLTGLYNSMTTEMLVNDYLGREGAGLRHGLIVMDIDDFKNVNDRWGHQTGDKVLRLISDACKASFRSTDIIGRIGGDEFVVFLKNVETAQDVIESAEMFRNYTRTIALPEAGKAGLPAVSIGIGMYPGHGTVYKEIFHKADAALYQIKENGKNGVKLYEQKDGYHKQANSSRDNDTGTEE